MTKLFVQNPVTVSVLFFLRSLRWWQRYLEILVISTKVSVCKIKFDGSQFLRLIGTPTVGNKDRCKIKRRESVLINTTF